MYRREKKLAIPKSRRMTVSWTCLALISHELIFFKGKSWAVTSKKEEAAKELIERIEFIIKSIPPEMISPELIPKMKNDRMQSSPPAIVFPETHSKVQGFPQGGNQLRQYGFSGIFEDECAFQEESEATYAAAEPTVRGGGRFVKVSSRAIEDKGFFKKIVFDKINAEDIRFAELPPVPPSQPMEGVQCWKNPENGFFVIDLHYTANPLKRGEAFREEIRRTMPVRQFMMEYEKSWMTYEGKAVYADFAPAIHITNVKPKFHLGLPLLLGWDSSGLTPAVVIGQLQGEQLVIFRELLGPGMGAQRFIPAVTGLIFTTYPQVTDLPTHTISAFDPAGLKKNEITEQTYLQELMKAGFTQIRPGPVTWIKRVESVNHWLVGLTQGKPKIVIYEPDCPVLTAGFNGGYRYADDIADHEPDKARPVKDIHSHPHDALQYLCFMVSSYQNQTHQVINIPTPKYGTSRRHTPRKERDV